MDSVMFSHSRSPGIVFESWYRFSFSIFVLLCQFYFEHFSHSTAERIFDRKAIRSLAIQIAANVLKLCKEAVMRR